MSELLDSLSASVTPALTDLGETLAARFLGGLEEILKGASEDAKDKVATLIKTGYGFKVKAMETDDQELARKYAEAVETTVRRVRTVLFAEALVASDSLAKLVSEMFSTALDGLLEISKVVLVSVASSLAKGAIAGLVDSAQGGEGFDPSSIFPFA